MKKFVEEYSEILIGAIGIAIIFGVLLSPAKDILSYLLERFNTFLY